jgi:hypothetical protein
VNMPGFTAEASIEKTREHYKMIAILDVANQYLYQAKSILDSAYRMVDPLTNWPIYVLGRPILEPSCICLTLDSQGRCIRRICF